MNPYRGLAPFNERDASRFFGRDREIEEVLDRLSSRRLLSVVGVSGCGKSSLIRAGVIPVLRMGVAPNLPPRWRICTMRPGADPLKSLAAAVGGPPDWPTNTFDLVDQARNGLHSGESLLLVVDQFEELFRFHSESVALDGGNAASLFVNLLLSAVDQREVPIYILLTMRTDFLGECAQFRGLPEALNDCYYLVPRMTRLQQQEAIEKPLQEHGAAIHASLTQRLLNDAADAPDHLPVLQHLLSRLWENWNARGTDEPIGIVDYDAVGGWKEALDVDAEMVLQRFKTDEEGIRLVFQWITERGAGEKALRRPRPFGECLQVSGIDRQRLDEIITTFQERGLLQACDRTDEALVDLPHESVTWQWSRLSNWVMAEAERAAQLRFLLHASRQQMVLTGLALESGLQLRSEWRKQSLATLRYFELEDLARTDAWIARSEEFDRRQRDSAEARELLAWAALSLGDDPERSLILGLYSWGKQRAMVAGLEELLHVALLRSPSRLSLRHQGSVWCVAWSPDGSKLATASSDATARVWDADTGEELQSFRDHAGPIFCVAWSPDGSKAATGGYDGTVIVWEASNGRILRTIPAHEYAVLSVAWSPDGRKVATASDDNTAKIWQVDTGIELNALRGSRHAVWKIAWSPDGNWLATASGTSVKIWDQERGRELVILRGHQGDVRSLAWSPDGTRLATASFDNTAKIWLSNTGRQSLTLSGHQDHVLDVAWSPDGTCLATTSFESVTKLWDADTGCELRSVLGHQCAVLGVAWSPDGRKLATASDDGTARVLDLRAGYEWLAFRGHPAPVWCGVWSPDSTKVASGSDRPTAKVWDANTGRELLTLDSEGMYVESVAWSPDGERLAISANTTVQISETKTGRMLAVLRGHEDYVGRIDWSPDGNRIATASRDHTARVWGSGTGLELFTIRGHEADVRSVAWSPNGSRLATASDDHTAKIWDADSGRALVTLHDNKYAVSSIAWSPDGSRVATASYDKTVTVWTASSGEKLLTLRGHPAAVLDVAWSPDGTKIATASSDNTARVWDAATGHELLRLSGHRLSLRSVAWSKDGKRLACAGADSLAEGVVQIYVIDETLLLQLVRSRITRELTPLECHHYLNKDECPPLPWIL
jgi:WD40 repeat protein